MSAPFRIKICGLTVPADAALAASLGADALGVVFWPHSPRAVDPARAADVLAGASPGVKRVGVFVDAALEDVARAAHTCALDLVQLAGAESPAYAREVASRTGARVIRSVHLDDAHAAARFADYPAVAFTLDASRRAGPGGTGVRIDTAYARRLPWPAARVILAGGLRAETVAHALAAVPVAAVDVCSGVEATPGRKDAVALHAFIVAARQALDVRLQTTWT